MKKIFGEMLKDRTSRARIGRFLVVGMCSTLVDFLVLTFLKQVGQVPTFPANLWAYLAGTMCNFWLNRQWVYPEARQSQASSLFLKFIMVSLIGLTLNNLLVLALETPFGRLLNNSGYGFLPAKLVATNVVLFWNYLANRYWTFSKSLNSLATD